MRNHTQNTFKEEKKMTNNEIVKSAVIKLLNGVAEFERDNGTFQLSLVIDNLTEKVRVAKELSDQDVHDIGEQIAMIYFDDCTERICKVSPKTR